MNMDDAKKQAAGVACNSFSYKRWNSSWLYRRRIFRGTHEISSEFNQTLVTGSSSSGITGPVTAFASGGLAAGGNVQDINGSTKKVTDEELQYLPMEETFSRSSFTHTINLEQYQPFEAFKLTMLDSQNTEIPQMKLVVEHTLGLNMAPAVVLL